MMERLSFLTKRANHLMWALPLAAGVAAYLTGGDAKDDKRQASPPVEQTRVAEKPRLKVGEALSKLREDEQNQKQASEAAFLAGLPQMSGEEMKRALLDLSKRQTDGRYDQGPDAPAMKALARELGRREGAAGADWLFSNTPRVYFSGVDGWAAEDPEGVLNYVANSRRPCPCSEGALGRLLQGRAAKGAEALRSAIESIHWEQFSEAYRQDLYGDEDHGLTRPGGCGLAQPEDPELRKFWRDSGAARMLAEHGMETQDLFAHWFQEDPASALENWATWPAPAPEGQEGSTANLIEWLAGGHGAEDVARIKQVIVSATPAARAKVIDSLHEQSDSDGIAVPRGLYPELFPAELEDP